MKILRFLLLAALFTKLHAAPSSLYWTNCTTGVKDTGTINFSTSNYFTMFKSHGKNTSFPTDIGLNFGLATWHDFSLEMGFDYLVGKTNTLAFSGKFGIKENKLFNKAPSFSFGIFSVSTKQSANQDVLNFVLGKELPGPIGGILYAGAFSGSQYLGKNRQGVMVGYDRGFYDAVDSSGSKYSKWHFLADYSSGKNAIGGGGFGLSYYFNKDIWVIAGPVWFNDRKLNGSCKWTLQFNFNIPAYNPSLMTWK